MARACDICGKGIMSGNNVSHSHRKTRRQWIPNLQSVKAVVNGTNKTLQVCTKCLKGNKVVKAVKQRKAAV